MSLRTVGWLVFLIAAVVGAVAGLAAGLAPDLPTVVIGAAVGLLVGVVTVLLLSPTVVRPVRGLDEAAARVAAGESPGSAPAALGIAEVVRAREALDILQTRLDGARGDLDRSRQEAAASLGAQARFLSTLSESIRTPMTGILGTTLELLETGLDASQRASAETIRASADSLLTVLNEVVDVSRIESGKVELESIDFDLGVLVEDAMDALGPKAREKGLSLAYEVEKTVPLLLRGDPGRLRLVLLHVVLQHVAGAAVRSAARGEVVVTVTLDGRSGDRASLRFAVAGPAPEAVSARAAVPGPGLVLARRLAERMGGFTGTEGSTSWFTVRLEVRGAPEAPVAPADLRGARVLVFDDHERARAALVHVLEAWGLRVETAGTPRDARDLLTAGAREDDPHRVLLVGAGDSPAASEAFGRAVRDDSALSSTRAILLATVGLRGDAARCAAAGYAAYLVRPVHPSHLFHAIASVLGEAPAGRAPSIVTRRSIEESRRRGARVLLVEDDEVNRDVARKFLERMGHQVDVARNGREAVDAVRTTAYDVVFMDVQMPVLDGCGATLEIRRREGGTTHVPIVAMTAGGTGGDRARCLSVGMDDYLRKPVRPEDLSSAVDRAWDRAARAPAGAPSSGAVGAA